jgi:hypothetical protein
MAGIAAATAEVYAKYQIPTLPIGDNKRPLVRNFKIAELTMLQSRAFMRRQPTADVIGVPDGPLSGIVRLDIDERGDDILREVKGKPGRKLGRELLEELALMFGGLAGGEVCRCLC